LPTGPEGVIADLRISELAALAGIDLAAGDLLAVADISASESKKITVTDFLGNAVTLIADATIPNAKILFSSASIPGSALANGAVGATQLASSAVTAAKLANESTVDLVTSLPASGAFVGQFALDTDDNKAYIWDGSQWVSFKAAGSINTAIGSTAGVVNVTVTTSGDQITIGTTLDDTANAAEFLAGPSGAGGAVSYRVIAGADLPVATTTAKGGVQVNGNGLAMSGDTLTIDNTVTPNTTEYHVVQYDGNGLVTDGRELISGDLPLASTGLAGAVYPGTGLTVSIDGELDHDNTVAAGTATKVTFDTEGHITASDALADSDIPNLSAAKLTTGTLDPARIGNSSITGSQLANYAVSKFGETQPTADHIGQFFFNPLSRDLFLWDGNVFQPIGISVGEIVFAGTFDASAGGGTGLVASVTAEGTAVGLIAGDALPAASSANSRYYLVVSEPGTITSGNAPNIALAPPDIILSNGNEWTEIDVSQTITAQVASNVSFTPAGDLSSTNVQAALQELDTEKLALAGGTMTGELLIGTAGSFAFEGSSANAFETYLAVVDPTADRTITFPDASGNIVLSGSIVNADINASAAIAFSKLASLTSANILVGSSGNVATSVAVTGDVTISNTGVTSIAAGAIVNADVSNSAAIAYSKLASLTSGNIILGNASGVPTVTAVTGDVTISNTGVTAIATGVIVDADVNASAAIAFSKLANVSATDRLLGRSTAGAGAIEEVTCTAAGRALIDDADAAAQRTTLGLAIGTDVQAYDADTAKTDVVQSFTAAQRGAITGLTDGATITPDFAVANNFSVTLGGNRTLANPSNATAGQSGVIVITQDGTGGRTLAYGSNWKFAGGTDPTLTTAANAVDVLTYYVASSTVIIASALGDVK
jgi:hypothetical protein